MLMRAQKWSIRGLAAWMLGLALMTPLGSAMADTTVFADPVGDSTTVDISRVRVAHRDSVTVRVRSAVALAAGQVYVFWIDAGRGGRPDYRVAFRANSDFDGRLRLVRSFTDRRRRYTECPGMRARADIFADQPVSLRIPRRCLENPEAVRVAVQFRDEITGTVDWAADRRTFGPRVER
jgi:hypothetical protein